MTAYFDGYVQWNSIVNEFVVQYEKAVLAHKEANRKEDLNTQVTLSRTHHIDRATKGRTRRVFRKFQKRLTTSNNCMHENLNKETCGGRYRAV